MSIVKSGLAFAFLLVAALVACGDSGSNGGAGSCEDASDCEPVECDGVEFSYCNRGRCESNPELVCRVNRP